MTRSCLVFAAAIASACLLNSLAQPASAEDTPLLHKPFNLLLQSGPGGHGQGLALANSPPEAQLMGTDLLVPVAHTDDDSLNPFLQTPVDLDDVPASSLRAFLAQETQQGAAEVLIDEAIDDRDPKSQSTDDGEKTAIDGPATDTAPAISESTKEHLTRLRKPVTEVKIEASEGGKPVPENIATIDLRQDPVTMIASVNAGPPLPDRYTIPFQHRPLLYEQRNLERCGGSFGYFQNTVSGLQFVANTMVLPYRICSQRAACPRPGGGDCKTCQSYPLDCNPLPLDRRGLVTEAAAIAGFSFLLL